MLKKIPALIFLLAAMMMSSFSLNAATVTYNVPDDYSTIQDAIDACTTAVDDYIIEVQGNDLGEYYNENLVIPTTLSFASLTIIGLGDFINVVDEDDPTPQYGYSSRIHGLEGDNPTIAIYKSNVTIKNLRILNLNRASEDPFSEDDLRNVLIYIAPGLENVIITQNQLGPQADEGTVINVFYEISEDEPNVYPGGTHAIFVEGNGSEIEITENEINGISGMGDAIRFEADETGFDDCTIQYNYSYNLRLSHLAILGIMKNSLIANNLMNDAGFYEVKYTLGGASSLDQGAWGNGIVLLNNNPGGNIEGIDISGNSIAVNLHTGLYIYGGVDDIYVSGNDFYLNMDAITLNGNNEEPFFPGDPFKIDANNSFNDVLFYRNLIYANTRFGIFNNTDYALCAQENYFEEPNEDFGLGGFDQSNGPQYAWGEFDHDLYYFNGTNFDGGRTFYSDDAWYKLSDDDANVVPGASMIYGKIDFSPYTYDLSDYSTRNITVDNSSTASEFDNISNAMLAVHSVCGRDIVEVKKTSTNYSEAFTIYNPVELVGIGGTPVIDPSTGPIITSVATGDSKVTGFQFIIPSSGGLGFIDENEDYTGDVYMENNTYFDDNSTELTLYSEIDGYITDDMDYTSNPRGSGQIGQFIFPDFPDYENPLANAKDFDTETGEGGTATINPLDLNDGSTDNSCDSDCDDVLTFTIIYDDNEYGPGELNLPIGTYEMQLKVCDEAGNCSISDPVTVTVNDGTDPVANAQDFDTETGEDGTATINPSDLNNGSTDNSCDTDCEDVLTFTIIYDGNEYGPGELNLPIGTYEMQLNVCDEAGNCSVSDPVTITVNDGTDPVANAQDFEGETGEGGTATINPLDLNDGSTDNSCDSDCDDVLTFTIIYDGNEYGPGELNLPIGTYEMQLKVCDEADNCSISDPVTVTVNDGTPPDAKGTDITVFIGEDGTITIDPEDLDDGSTDNSGGPLTFTASQTTFNASDLGDNTVTLTVCDASNNCSSVDVTVTVIDNTPPVAKGKNITVQLGQNGTVTITPQDVDDGSYDNSGSVTLSIDQDEFDAPGTYEVTLTVEDGSGNFSSVTVLVTVVHYPFNLTNGVLWLDAGTTSQKCKGSKLPLSPPNTWSWEDLTQYDNHAKQQYKDNIPHTLPKKVGSSKKRGIFFNEHQCNEKNSDFLKVANASDNLNSPDYDKSVFVVFTTKNNIGDKCNCKDYNHKHDSKCKHEDEDEDDEDCGKCSGGVTNLTLKYTGNSAYIKVVQKDGKILYSSYVTKNSTFSFTGKGSGNKMGTDIKLYINGCFYKSIHTSCSQPIGPGLEVGNFTVISGESYKGGNLCSINSDGDDDDGDDDDDKGKGTKDCKMVLFEMGGTSSGINFYIEGKKFYAGVWGNGKSHFRSFNISRKTTYMARLKYNSGTDRFDIYLNGSGHEGIGTVELRTDNSDNGVGAAVGGTRFHDGSFSGTGKFYDGYIGEIIVHNSANDEVWESTKDYLCSKYGFGNNCNNNWARENNEYVDYQMTDEVEIFEAYPNPFELNTNFSMAVRQAQPVSIDLFNALGEKVQTIFQGSLDGQTYYEFNIDGSNLPSGIYIYKVSGTTFTRSGKLILNK